MEPNIITQDGEKYLSINQAMAEFGYSRRTLYNWMNSNLVKVKTAPGGLRYIEYNSLLLKDWKRK